MERYGNSANSAVMSEDESRPDDRGRLGPEDLPSKRHRTSARFPQALDLIGIEPAFRSDHNADAARCDRRQRCDEPGDFLFVKGESHLGKMSDRPGVRYEGKPRAARLHSGLACDGSQPLRSCRSLRLVPLNDAPRGEPWT